MGESSQRKTLFVIGGSGQVDSAPELVREALAEHDLRAYPPRRSHTALAKRDNCADEEKAHSGPFFFAEAGEG